MQTLESKLIFTRAVSSWRCNELMMMLKKVKGVRHSQFSRTLPSAALTRSGIKLPGDGI